MLNFLKPAPAIQRLPDEKIGAAYARYRIQVFISIYVGYLAYYFVRGNFAFAKEPLSQAFGFTTKELGFVGTGIGIAYGISKLVMGNLSDRSNPRYFLAMGLIASGLVNLLFPKNAGSLGFMFILMLINGWVQGMGWAPCSRIMTHWFSVKERGLKMSMWNTSANIGAALMAWLTTFGTEIFTGNKFEGVFYLPGIISIVCGILYIILARDTPQSVGLPPIEEYKNDYPSKQVNVENSEVELSGREIFFKYVLNNKMLWCLAIANIFVYAVRYGVAGWAPKYLGETMAFDKSHRALAFAMFELVAIPSQIVMGWMTDKIFKGRRTPVCVACMVGALIGLVFYWKSRDMVSIYIAIGMIGCVIYGPVGLIGVSAVDLVPKKAAGTAGGFTGLFGYMFGQVMAEGAMGAIVHNYKWDGGFIALIICCVLAIFFLSFTWNSSSSRAKSPKAA